MAPEALMQVLHQLPHVKDGNLLVGIETADDASVYRITDELALVSTVDFFPPIVDDPYTFGQVSAANALSDVYAMGGSPRLAMNIVAFPKALDLDILGEIIKGSMDKLREADTLLVGGHSIEDKEVKYGLSVTGFVDPEKITTNKGAVAGDRLILTKPLGTGVITTALKDGRCAPYDKGDAISRDAIASMKTLNRAASEAMVEAGARACTDVTGFGLLGHAFEMADASGVSFVIRSGEVRLFPEAIELIKKKKNRPKSIESNREFLLNHIEIDSKVDKSLELLLYDPQTSGGLLIAIPGAAADGLMGKLRERGVAASVIGEVVEKVEKKGRTIRVE